MVRHAAHVPSARRIAGASLGGTTLLVLFLTLWLVGRPGARTEEPPAGADAATTTRATATLATTVTTSPTTTEPTPTTDSSTTTTTATTIPTTPTTTTPPLLLESDGLDVVDFGATTEEVVAAVSERLGGADSDSGWVSAQGTFGTCPGNLVRVIRWDSLRAFFGDGPTEFGEDQRHFFYYSQSSVDTDTVIDLRTAAGIGIGDTVRDLTDAYGSSLTIDSTARFGVTFTVDTGDGGLLSGTLTESVETGQVTSIAGGFGCGG